ncbi:glycoside hydrolase family 31 protein [Levilactobacillus acidifarinae]|uniref:Glycosyl hydrolase, family 31 n=1 Tax=Levilactobacillus acidifarinae DSM 19394 = JCM 15949 TaxID=1423715 RepID=A0A0R1LUX8_9LACO|nr:glycoside hydrolase family 31 protein [Levilactobacillus acidifarinae]KRK96218.1 glycosyl hydrolase, family 31 [Levilactobacillus acidifarinae DSM 19394]GEO69581.1 alpha-glucosidase [Levilactobacillus acidifarinae]
MTTLPTYTQTGQTVTFNFATNLQLTVLTASIIHLFSDRGEPGTSYAVEGDKQQPTAFTVTNQGDHYDLTTAALTVHLDATGHVDVDDAAGHPLITDYRGKRQLLDKGVDKVHQRLVEAEGHSINGATVQGDQGYQVIKALAADEHLYGLGDKPGYLDKRGYEYDNWNSDNPDAHLETFTKLYKSIPVLLGLKNGHPYGLFFDNPYRSHFDLGKESPHYYFYSVVAGNLDYYILGGASLKAVVTNYTYLTGRTPLPQKWTLGYQQSRWGYSASQKEVQAIADDLEQNDLPCDAIHFDVDYMRGYRVFTWDTDKYPAGPGEFIAQLKQRGIRVIPIIDPGVKQDPDYAVYATGLKNDYFVKSPNGQVYINQVWPGNAAFPDFGRPAVRDWWAHNVKFLTDLGVAGVWNDMNEPASFQGPIPNDVVFSDQDRPATHKKMHNVYGHNMAQATYAGLKAQQHRRPFVITRAAYAGTQKYATVWTGDNQSIWPHVQLLIPQLCTLGLSGFSFVGTDIGGFGADTTPELLTRWIEAGLFSPLFRNHAAMGTRHQEPWVFGEPTLSIYRKYLKLRYRFVPYLYDLFAQETQTGLPIMRPLVLNDDQDPRNREINDEYMVGDTVLVAPVVQQGQTKRLVYLPRGEWVDFWNNREYAGQQDIVVDAPLDKLPLFVRKNTLLPWGPAVSHIGDQPDTAMTFRLFGDHGTYDHYQDNGTDFKYQTGEWNGYRVAVSHNQVTVTLTHHGYAAVYQTIHVALADRVVTLTYQASTQTYGPQAL